MINKTGSNTERTRDRDLSFSELMRYPGTTKEDLNIRREGFDHLRSFDVDVSPLCDRCAMLIAVFEATRDINGYKATRYVQKFAEQLGVTAFLIKHLEAGLDFYASVTNLSTEENFTVNSKESYVEWVESLYLSHVKERH
jgi:hypothetical protein